MFTSADLPRHEPSPGLYPALHRQALCSTSHLSGNELNPQVSLDASTMQSPEMKQILMHTLTSFST